MSKGAHKSESDLLAAEDEVESSGSDKALPHSDMEKRIELERRARKADQIASLNLDNCRSTSIVGLTDEYTALETLSLINVGLTTLKGFPKLPNLRKLELSDNRISSGLNYLTTSSKLQCLNLSGNRINDIETLKPLAEFKNLALLDLFNNGVTQVANYREKIFAMLPSLQYLDGFDCNDEEAPSDSDEEDVNSNTSDLEDGENAFCINGLEIDLDELAEFEKRIDSKRKQAHTAARKPDGSGDAHRAVNEGNQNQNAATDNQVDELDEYLKELKLRETASIAAPTPTPTPNSSTCTEGASVVKDARRVVDTGDDLTTERRALPFVIVLYWFLAILNLASAATYSDDSNEDDEEGSDEVDFSLSEVYNDDLEEDNSEWEEVDGAAAESDDLYDDDEDDVEGEDGEGNTEASGGKAAVADKDAAAAAVEEPQTRGKEKKKQNNLENSPEYTVGSEDPPARGKKRKHDGEPIYDSTCSPVPSPKYIPTSPHLSAFPSYSPRSPRLSASSPTSREGSEEPSTRGKKREHDEEAEYAPS